MSEAEAQKLHRKISILSNSVFGLNSFFFLCMTLYCWDKCWSLPESQFNSYSEKFLITKKGMEKSTFSSSSLVHFVFIFDVEKYIRLSEYVYETTSNVSSHVYLTLLMVMLCMHLNLFIQLFMWATWATLNVSSSLSKKKKPELFFLHFDYHPHIYTLQCNFILTTMQRMHIQKLRFFLL